MGRVYPYFQYVRGLFVLLLTLALCACSEPPKPPKTTLRQETVSTCKGIKISGTITSSDFTRLFHCLNENGALDPLKPLVIQDKKNQQLFIRIYNQSFGSNPELRTQSLRLLRSLHRNGGLDDFLTVIGNAISEFIDVNEFDTHLKPLLKTILQDDLNLVSVLRSVVLHPETPILAKILKESYHNDLLGHSLITLGSFLRSKDQHDISGAVNVVDTLKAFFSFPGSKPSPFTWSDIEQFHVRNVVRNLLDELYKLKRESKLDDLVKFVSDLAHRQTTTALTQERQRILKEQPHLLNPRQLRASQDLLKKHPKNDFVALIKLASGLHRRFMEDENATRKQNLLESIDIFNMGVKSAFDSNHSLGPDSDATRVMTTYSIYTNIAYQEIMFADFHTKPIAEKIAIYKTDGNPYSDLYQRYITHYQRHKIRVDQSAYRSKLEDECDPNNPDEPRWSPREIRRKLRKRKREFTRDILPGLAKKYTQFLDDLISKAFSVVNTKKIFFNSTIYDLLIEMKKVKSIGQFFEKLLLNLDNEELDKFFSEITQGLIKDFFDFNRPVDTFMRSLDREHSGATWLAHTVDPLIYGFDQGMPMKNQITIVSLVESYQIIERLLIKENHKENHIETLRNILLPFIKAINKEKEDERIFRFFQFLHSGEFKDGASEEGQLINKLQPLLIHMMDSGFFKQTLEFMAALGKRPDTTNRLMTFLLLSQSKREFVKYLKKSNSQGEDPQDIDDIEFAALRAVSKDENQRLLKEISDLRAQNHRNDLTTFVHSKLFPIEPNRLISPVIETLKRMSMSHTESFVTLLNQTGHFLSSTNVNHFIRFLDKYQNGTASHKRSESFLTQLFKRDEMDEFIGVIHRMLEDDVFKSTQLFIKELIDTGELKRALHLLTIILLNHGSVQ